MGGINLQGNLTFKTFVARTIGITSMLSSGMCIGKEGPFIHVASCIANTVPYRRLQDNSSLRHQFMTAAVAVGVTATFGAPIGGVLFAIEVSSTTFTVANLWKSFFASTITIILFKLAGFLSFTSQFKADAPQFYS